MLTKTMTRAESRDRPAVVRVLVVHRAIGDVRRARNALQGLPGFRVRAARDLDEGEALLAGGAFDAALIESSLWNGDGGSLVQLVRERHLDIAVVLVMGGSQREALPALKLGAHDFVSQRQLDDPEHLAARVLAAVAENRSSRRRDTMVRWLEREARTDHLTGLATRRAFDERLQEVCREARAQAAPVSLILLDIRGTRDVNEAYGHEAGDAMIRRTGLAVLRSIRGGDFAARLGGDDFGVVLSEGDLEVARRVARRIAHELDRSNAEDQAGVPVSVVFGVASGTKCEPGQLFAAADQQLSGYKHGRPAVTPLVRRTDNDGPSVA
jgi:diguanylate cyclase (GGDEF)-like protein